MFEFPETESKRELDDFAAAFERAVTDTPEHLHAAPRNLSRWPGSMRCWRAPGPASFVEGPPRERRKG